MSLIQDKFIRPSELSIFLGVSKSTLWRWRKKKLLPEPVKIGSGVVIWKKSDVELWLNECRATS